MQTTKRGLGRDKTLHIFRSTMVLPCAIRDVFQFFSDAANLERITPPELRFRIITPLPITVGEGTMIDYKLRLYGIPFQWTARIHTWEPPFGFVDTQVEGPYRLWVHTHRFFEEAKGTRVTDEVLYGLSLWPLGEALFPLIYFLLAKIFRYRKQAIRHILIGE